MLLAIGISKAEGKSKDLSAKDAKTRRALTKIANYPLNNKDGVVIIGNNNENNIYVAINHNNAKQLSNDLNLKADDVFPDEIIHKNVILRLAQGNDINPLKTNKGIIYNFDSKAKTLLFDDDAVRESILHGRNPFLVYFAVDVAVRSVDDKIVAYVIKSCNGVISDEEDSKESIPTLFT